MGPERRASEDGVEDFGAAVVDGVFVLSGGQSALLLEVAVGAFDDLAALVVVGVQCGWASALGAAGFAVADLLGSLRNGDFDCASDLRGV